VLVTAGAILILSCSQPELLTGSLRKNIDLLEQYDDATLNNALRTAGLFALQDETDDGKLNLDSEIASGGGNLSVGQRQILALGGYPWILMLATIHY
jgi:ABC-type multidrug transport system fused ATPase/permease subunit